MNTRSQSAQQEKFFYIEPLQGIALLWPIVFLVLGLAAILCLPACFNTAKERIDQAFEVWVVFLLCAGVAGLIFFCSLASVITAATKRIYITNKAVRSHWGLIGKYSSVYLLHKIQSYNCSQGIYGRLFNCGSVTITGTGGEQSVLSDIKNFGTFQLYLQQAIIQAKDIQQ